MFPVSTYYQVFKHCYATKHGKELFKNSEVRPGHNWHQNSDINGREVMVSTRSSGKTITGNFGVKGRSS